MGGAALEPRLPALYRGPTLGLVSGGDNLRPVIPVSPEGEANWDSRAESLGISSHAPTCGTGMGNTAEYLSGPPVVRARRLMV
jgi:hypothetical protein